MNSSFIFVPRMHENISDCYQLITAQNPRNASVNDIDTATSDSINIIAANGLANASVNGGDHSNATLGNMKNISPINVCYFNPFSEKEDGIVKKYAIAIPEFPWKKETAYQYLKDLKESSMVYAQETQSQIKSYSTTYNGALPCVFSGESLGERLPINRLNKEEEFSLNNFVKGSYEYGEKMPLVDENMAQKKALEQAQKMMIIAWLQEEQDMDLFVIEQNISQKDHAIQSLLKNPYEDKLRDSESFDEELQKYLFEKEKAIKESFTFNVLGKQQKFEKNIFGHAWSVEDFKAFEFSTNWQQIFLAQLHFMPEHALFVVNDRVMRDNLLEIAMHNKDKVRFDENISSAHYKQEELIQLQKTCSQTPLHYSLLCCPFEVVFKEKNSNLSIKYKKKGLHFLLTIN